MFDLYFGHRLSQVVWVAGIDAMHIRRVDGIKARWCTAIRAPEFHQLVLAAPGF